MSTPHGKSEETRLAEEIVSVLPSGSVARACSTDRHSVCFVVRHPSWRLAAVVLSRASLRRLQRDPDRAVKIEYLQRDLLRSAASRAEFVYPRPRVAPAGTQTERQLAVTAG